MKQILEALDKGFKAFDDKGLESDIAYFLKLKADFRAYEESEEGIQFRKQTIRTDPWGYYAELYRRCGGKTNYAFIKESDKRIVEIVTKDHNFKIARRNIKISKKLAESNITEVNESKVTMSDDGFNGYFKVVTDKGVKFVNIDTIYAGGYNIQRFHCRVLVKIK